MRTRQGTVKCSSPKRGALVGCPLRSTGCRHGLTLGPGWLERDARVNMDDPAAHAPDELPGGPKATVPTQRQASASAQEQMPSHPQARTSHPEAAQDWLDLYEAFYREFLGRLVIFLVWMGANLSEAADIAQETMIDAYRNWASIEHPGAWAKRVASRKYARHISRVDTVALPESLSPLLAADLDPADWEERHDVLRILSVLPPRQRQVMAWTYDG